MVFRENVRLAEEKERIFEERRKLEHEFRIKHDTLDKKISIAKLKIVQLDEATKLVEKKLAALEEEYVHLAIEKISWQKNEVLLKQSEKQENFNGHIQRYGYSF